MVKKLFVACIAATAFCGAPALAADMALKAPPPVVAPVNSWTGWYVGLNAGGAWGRAPVNSTLVPPNANDNFVGITDSPTLTPKGFTGGGQIGYNYQLAQWLVGLEADFGYFGLKNGQTINSVFPGGGPFTVTPSTNTSWLATVRPRLGYVVNRAIVYATGGLAVTNVHFSDSFSDSIPGQVGASSVSSTKTGWTAGGGLEYAMSNNWSVKVEYLYLDFGSVSSGDVIAACLGPCIQTHNVRLTSDLVRAGLNYKY